MAVHQRFPFLRFGVNVNRLIAADDDCLEVLLAENAAHAAGAVALVEHHVGHRHKIFTRWPNHADARVSVRFLSDHRVGALGALVPHEMRIAQFDVIIVNVEVAGLLGFAFNDDEVPAGILHLVRDFAAHVRARNQRLRPRSRPKRRECGAARTDGAGAGERTRGDDHFVFRGIAVRVRRNFVPEHAVAEGGAAD